MKNRILITGSAGFIGYHLSESLLKDDFRVFGIDNINNYYSVELKKRRLLNLEKSNNFTFRKVDISNVKSLYFFL